MKVKVKFPLNPGGRNHKMIRESILLDTTGNSFESTVFAAAEAAAETGHEVFVARSYGPAGRWSVWIADQRETERRREGGKFVKSTSGTRMERRKALQRVLGRVSI